MQRDAAGEALSDNGNAAFASAADNLVVGDTQRIADVFVARHAFDTRVVPLSGADATAIPSRRTMAKSPRNG